MKPSVWMAVPLDLSPIGPQAFYTSSEDLATQWAYHGCDGHQVTVTGMVSIAEARAAVAELIEAAREFHEANENIGDRKAGNAHERLKRYGTSERRIRAALARVGGAS